MKTLAATEQQELDNFVNIAQSESSLKSSMKCYNVKKSKQYQTRLDPPLADPRVVYKE